MTINAEIFKKIAYVYYPQSKKRADTLMIPAFPVDPTNAGRMKTAIQWAKNQHESHFYNQETGSYEPREDADIKCEPLIQEHENKPFSGLKIVDLEVRGNGGRAYKVVLPNKLFFDMREDVLMETINEVGISPGGVLNGEFIWCRVGSETKLVLVGSKLYGECLKAMTFKAADVIKKDFEIGEVYRSKDNYILFCGKIYCSTAKGSIVERNAWLQCYESYGLKKAIKTFEDVILNREKIKNPKEYDYRNPIVTAQAGKLPACRPAKEEMANENQTELFTFSIDSDLKNKIIELVRAAELETFLRIQEYYELNLKWDPEAERQKHNGNWWYTTSRTNPHSGYDADFIRNLLKNQIEMLTISNTKTTCVPTRKDHVEFLEKSKINEIDKWLPNLKL